MKQFPIFILLSLILINCHRIELPVNNGVTEELAHYRKSIVSDINYELKFSIPINRKQPIKGSAIISLELKNKDQNLQLDFKGDTLAKYKI